MAALHSRVKRQWDLKEGRELVIWTHGRKEFQEEGIEDAETLWRESLGRAEEIAKRPNVSGDY